MTKRRVLISGASIAGPTLAFWLHSYGFQVTVVERAPSLRKSDYPIDVRGTALDVLSKMGLLEKAREARIAIARWTYLNESSNVIAVIQPELMIASTDDDIELPRGVLTESLVELTIDTVSYRFNDSIASLDDSGESVLVEFASGSSASFDIVIGADGVHSNTRKLVFGPENQFRIDFGYRINYFSMPNDLALANEAMIYAVPGCSAAIYATGDGPKITATFMYPTPSSEPLSIEDQRKETAAVFAACGWQVPKMLKVMQNSDNLYFDSVSQIKMDTWSRGRIGLVGDAAYAPSLLTGQGTSLAIVGAYVLAGELACHENTGDAFSSYEKIMRPFVEANQTIATEETIKNFVPRTQADIEARNKLLKKMEAGEEVAHYREHAQIHNLLKLPAYHPICVV